MFIDQTRMLNNLCVLFWSLNDGDRNSRVRSGEKPSESTSFQSFRRCWSSFVQHSEKNQSYTWTAARSKRTQEERRHILMTTVVEIILKGVRHYNRIFLPKRKKCFKCLCLSSFLGYWQHRICHHISFPRPLFASRRGRPASVSLRIPRIRNSRR